jgi:dGTPase
LRDDDVAAGALEAAAARLVAAPYWAHTWDGSRPALAGLKNMTSQLIGEFCQDAARATRERFGPGRLTRYSASLVVPAGTAAEIAVLKALAAVFVMEPRLGDRDYVAQREMIAGLYERMVERGPSSLEPEFRGDWERAGSDGERRRVVVDQIASLTDKSATLLYEGKLDLG